MKNKKISREELLKRINDALSRKSVGGDMINKSADELFEDISIYHQELEVQNWELLRVQEQLEAYKRHYEALFFNAPVGYVVFTRQNIIRSVNHAFARLVRREKNEIIGESMTAFIHPESQDFFYFHIRRLLDAGESTSEQLMLTSSPELDCVSVKIDSNLFDEGDEQLIRSVFVDISREKANERALARQHEWSIKISEARGVEQAVQLGLQAAIDVSGMECGVCYMLQEGQVLDLTMQSGLGQQFVEKNSRFQADSPQCRFLLAVRPQYCSGLRKPSAEEEFLCEEEVTAYAVLPLAQPDGPVGSLVVCSYHMTAIPPQAKEALETIAAVAAEAVTREMAVQSLRESETRYKSLFDNTPAGIFRTTSTGKVLRINKAMATILGYPDVEEPLRYIRNLNRDLYVDPDRRGDFIRLILQKDMVEDFEYEARRFDGKTVWLSMNARISERCDDGSFIIDGFALDITQRRIAEDATRFEKARAQQYLDVAQTMLLALDTRERVILINPKGCEILGYSSEEIIGRNWFETFLVSDEVETFRTVYNRLLCDEIDSRSYYESRVRCRDGSIRLIGWRKSPLRDASGKITGVFSSGDDITDRNRAEAQLRESERNFRLLFEHSPFGTYIALPDGTVLDANEALLKILGSPSLEATKQLNVLNIPSLQDNGYADAFRRCVAEGLPILFERQYTSHWGKLSILSNYIIPLKDERGGVEKIYTIMLDVTEQRSASEALRKSEEKYRTLFETMAQGVVYQDAQGAVISVNQAASDILGLSLDQLLGRTSVDSRWRPIREDGSPFPGEAHPAMVSLREGRPVHDELMGVFNPRDNDYRWIFVSSIPMFHPGESVPYQVYATITDVTPLKKVEKALRESETKYRHIFESIDDLYYQTDSEERLTVLSASAYSLAGYTPEELIGTKVSDLYVNPEDRKLLVEEFFRSGRVYDYEVVLKKKDGSPIHCSLSARLLRDADGCFSGIAGMLRDISGRKAAEVERERLIAQLNQAQKLESIGRLAGGVAHDFNNMLQGILGYTTLALDKTDPESRLGSYLKEIKKAAERSASLTKQLLAFARRQTAAPVALDLNEAVSGMLKMLRRLIGEDVQLVWNPGHDIWKIKIDPTQVDQILANMSVNARDAIMEHGIISIETRNIVSCGDVANVDDEMSPGNYVLLSFSDNGIGIDKESQKLIFEPFFTTKEMGQGTGLGLATVYGIIKQNGGYVTVISEPGHGTTFLMFFPVVADDSHDEKALINEVPNCTGEGTILLVDDEDVVLQTGQLLLENLGYRVLPADSPHKALEIAASFSDDIDLLITDVIMPGMNGRELAGHVQAMRPRTRCLYMSGYTADVIAREGVVERDVDLLVKPFSMSKLSEKVREILCRDCREE